MNENTYNGWRNYATWRVNLELCDDYVTSRVNDIADEVERGIIEPDEVPDRQTWADELAEYVDEILSESCQLDSIALDYARSFVADVDWYEIAEHAMQQLE